MRKDNQGDTGRLWTVATWKNVFILLRLTMGCIFIFASYDKIVHPQAFSVAVANYQILPAAYINFVAITLPWLELVIGVCLIAGIWLRGASVLCSGLLTIFIVALVYNQIRGVDISCGCFSTEVTHEAAGVGTILRDAGFLIMSWALVTMVLFPRKEEKIL